MIILLLILIFLLIKRTADGALIPMGAVLQTAGAAELAAELTCCACSSICGLAARNSSTRVKFRYCSFLLLATVTCVIVMIPGLRAKIDKIPNLCNKVVSPDTCDKFVGFGAVYRIIFAVTAFHLILALLTFRAKKVNSFRARLNNGLWFFKMGLIFGLTLATFYIPKRTGFFRVWMYLSLTGGFMFLMFQIMLVIDLGNSWSIAWAEKLETGYTKLWYLALALVTVLLFAVSFAALITFYVYFTHPTNIMKCNANFFYISFMGMQCILAVAISVTPSVQNFLPGAGLLQSSVVVMYALYLTWNTLSSEPDTSCNPLGNIILEYDSYTGISGASIFGCLVTLVLLIFACTVRTSTSHLGKYGLALAESEQYAMSALYEDTKKMEQLQTEDDILLTEYAGYNYSFFHLIMSFASMHLLMVLTNWHSPEEDSSMKTLVKNWSSVWVQMASSFACVLMYVWFLVTPLVKRVWGPTFGVNFNETVVYEKSIRGNLQAFNKRQNQPIVTQQPVSRDSIQPMNEKDVTQSSALKIPSKTDSIRARLKQSFESFQTEISEFKHKPKFENENYMKKHSPSREFNIPSKVLNVQKLDKISTTNSEVLYNTACDRKRKSSLDDKTVRNFNKLFNEREAGKRSVVSTRLNHREPPIFTNGLNNREHKQNISRVSTSTRRSNFYDYKWRRKRRSEFVSRYDTNNSSIETINSWINPDYRAKYRPLRQNFDSDYLIEEEEKLSPIENSSNVYFEHDNESNTRRSLQKTSSLTIKIQKSSHSKSKFPMTTNYDKAIDDDTSQDLFRPSRKKMRNPRINHPLKTYPNVYKPLSRNQASSSVTSHKKKNTAPSSSSMYRDRLEESFKAQNNVISYNPPVDNRWKNTGDRRIEILQEKENQKRNETNEFSCAIKPTQNISLVPSVFKKKAQSSETAAEILALQWKILKTQAKIVKIQQRIHNLHNSNSSI